MPQLEARHAPVSIFDELDLFRYPVTEKALTHMKVMIALLAKFANR